MPLFEMPIILTINADSPEEAQAAIDDWREELEQDRDLPVGTEDVNTAPDLEIDDEDRRVLYLSPIEDEDVSNKIDMDIEDDDPPF